MLGLWGCIPELHHVPRALRHCGTAFPPHPDLHCLITYTRNVSFEGDWLAAGNLGIRRIDSGFGVALLAPKGVMYRL